MDKLEKIGFTALLSALFAWLGIVAVPFLLLVLLQLIDYGTGLAAAKYRSEKISSYKSFWGIVKKICMWLLVVVGGVMDWLVTYAANNVGIQLEVSFVCAIIVCAWLMINEIISVLENMIDIGVKLPPFMMKFAKRIKGDIEKKADAESKEDSDDGSDNI